MVNTLPSAVLVRSVYPWVVSVRQNLFLVVLFCQEPSLDRPSTSKSLPGPSLSVYNLEHFDWAQSQSEKKYRKTFSNLFDNGPRDFGQ